MEVVAETVLSVSLELLFEELSSSDVLKFARQEHLQTQLKIWETKLLEIREVLNDAEEKQIAKESVKGWLSDLRDLAYDMEDVLDEFSYEALSRKHLAESSTSSKVRKFIPTCCAPVQAFRNVKMGSKMKDLNTRLEAIYTQKAGLGLDKVAAITQSTWERPPTTSLAHEHWVFGRDADKQNLMDMLLKDDEPNQTDVVSIVSIVAMGGMGKTTLARLVYDEDKITNHFNLKAWACVSDPFDAVRVTKTILNGVTSGISNDCQELSEIQDKLREALKGKKFMLVLDDIWTDNYDDWVSLQPPFWSGAPGSKIIITTRNKNVATMIMGGYKNLYELRHLTDDDCWSVFQKHAFGNRSVDEHPNLFSIGKQIVKKCGGLPLAARALGGLLRNEQREDKWNIILSNPIWDLPGDHKCSILPALRLSYNVLPSPLKRCFGYCAIFPKDYEFDKEELVQLWMAEGFIQQSKSDRQKREMEDLGDDYFQELLSRSFFQPSSSEKSSFVMHDLVNDLAKFVAAEICFSLEENFERNHQRVISEKFRHSSFIRGEYDVFKKFEVFHGMEEHLRSFVALPIGVLSLRFYWLSNKVLEELVPKFKCLRVLSLSDYEMHEIPDSIGDLKHLRYLDFSNTKVKCLPKSIGNLYKLQTLVLSKCSKLLRLPLSIGNLNSLRYLDVSGTPLEEMFPQISKLKSLQVLSTFIVGNDNDSFVKELKNMSHLRGSLHISKLENVINVQDARAACLDKKHKLENLRMSWSDSGNAENQLEILDCLQPHLGLNELTIEKYGGLKFPRWLDNVRFGKMAEIKLVNCKNCILLPCLGQLPKLKHLKIEGMDGVKSVGKEFHGGLVPFPKLESLTFNNMPQWEDWETPSSLSEWYPHLLHLTIINCPKLTKELPTYLPSLEHLDIWKCPLLESPLARFPSLSQLYIEDCNEGVFRGGVDFHSLEKLGIFKILQLVQLQEGFLQFCSGLQVLNIRDCDELRWFWEENEFDDIQPLQTRSCPMEHHGLLSKLQFLEIDGCRNLEKLPNGLHRLICLKQLGIGSCPKLSSFPNSGFPPMLTRFDIWHCEGLTRLPDWIMVARDGGDSHVCVLEHLSILGCPSLICFPEGQLPPKLQTLSIKSCQNLESLPEGQYPSTLKELKISSCEKLKSLPGGMMMQPHDSTSSDGGLHVLEIKDCSSLKCFPAGKFPSTLKELTIRRCQQLEPNLEKMFHSNNNNNSLEYLVILWCPSLKIIPDCLYNLRTLSISYCENLERLPDQLSQNLQQLEICDCENLELVPYQLQGLTALTSLYISRCKRMKVPLSQWGLAMLPSLKNLTIGGIFPEIISFSFSDGSSLPTTLTSLHIREFQNLKSLTSLSLQTLTSLQELRICICPQLQSFCPKEGLPERLSRLDIYACPLLKERCSKHKGQDWAHISHIPCVEIDNRDAFR